MSHCSNQNICPNGSCTGCKDGNLWCSDPRCTPYCPECEMPKNHETIVAFLVIVVVIILTIIIFIMIYSYGPYMLNYHNNSARANVLDVNE